MACVARCGPNLALLCVVLYIGLISPNHVIRFLDLPRVGIDVGVTNEVPNLNLCVRLAENNSISNFNVYYLITAVSVKSVVLFSDLLVSILFFQDLEPFLVTCPSAAGVTESV